MTKEISHNKKYAAHVFGVFEKAAVTVSKEKLIEATLIAVKGSSIRRKHLEALSEDKLREVLLGILKRDIPKLVEEGLEEKIRSMVQAEPTGE